jgi:flagellar hook-length control protein FliK
MNSASGFMAISPLQALPQSSPELEPDVAAGAGFSDALAAVGVFTAESQGETSIVEPSSDNAGVDAALALLAGMMAVGKAQTAVTDAGAKSTAESLTEIAATEASACATQAAQISDMTTATGAAVEEAVAANAQPVAERTFEDSAGSLAERELSLRVGSKSALATTRTVATDITARTLPKAAFSAANPVEMAVAAVPQASVAAVTRLVAAFPTARGSEEAVTTGAVTPQGWSYPMSGGARDASSVAAVPNAAAEPGIGTAVGSGKWADELGSRVMLMSVRGQNEGSLTLTPEHLGPLEVRISVSQDSADVWFGAQHADTRAALTDALPRLREMFAASGLSLGQASVSHEAPRQGARDNGTTRSADRSRVGVSAIDAAAPVVRRIRSTLIDTYA